MTLVLTYDAKILLLKFYIIITFLSFHIKILYSLCKTDWNFALTEARVTTYTIGRDHPIMLLFLPINYAAVLINFTYYAQYYAHVKDLCLGIQ